MAGQGALRLPEDIDTAVRLAGVHKTFRDGAGKDVRALAGLDLEVRSGECLVVIGPTGCGKTTLLNIVAGLDHPDAGTVTLDADMDISSDVRYVFQHYTLFPWRNILRNVTFGPDMRGTRREESDALALELLARVGLAGRERAYPYELSGGQRQRAAIAQAFVARPKLLLMDEPFGALDDATRQALQNLLVDLRSDVGMTTFFVTHNIDEAVFLGDRVVVMGPGGGGIKAIVDVSLPHPRDRAGQEFVDLFLGIRKLFSGIQG